MHLIQTPNANRFKNLEQDLRGLTKHARPENKVALGHIADGIDIAADFTNALELGALAFQMIKGKK